MSKQKQSKLDPFAERLTQWFTPRDKGGDGLTIEQARAQLKLDGCTVSTGRLSEWWQARQSELLQDKLLKQISTGANQVREVEKMLAKNPAPETETLIKLVRVLILKFSTEANMTPEMSELVFNMLKPVIKWHEVQGKAEERSFNREKWQRETCELFIKWFADEEAKKILSSNVPTADKTERLGQRLFGDLWK
jgi:hypothetical protein